MCQRQMYSTSTLRDVPEADCKSENTDKVGEWAMLCSLRD